jgi:uncharacterized OB-fold protein
MNTAQSAGLGEAVWRSANGKLLVKKCNACAAVYYYPRPLCPHCMSKRTEWLESEGRGRIYAFSIVRQKNAEPYVISFVTLDEGISLMTNIVETPIEKIAIGMPVSVAFRDVDGRTVPMFVGATPTQVEAEIEGKK